MLRMDGRCPDASQLNCGIRREWLPGRETPSLASCLAAVSVLVLMAVIVGMIVTAPAAALAVRMGVLVLMIVVMRMVVPAAAPALVGMGVRVIMPVVVRMPMVVRMIVPASAAIAVVMMLARIGQHGRHPALERDRLVARCIPRLDGQCHHFGAEPEVVHLAEVVAAQAALPVEDQHRRRALDFEGFHRLRQALAVALVERHRESQPRVGFPPRQGVSAPRSRAVR